MVTQNLTTLFNISKFYCDKCELCKLNNNWTPPPKKKQHLFPRKKLFPPHILRREVLETQKKRQIIFFTQGKQELLIQNSRAFMFNLLSLKPSEVASQNLYDKNSLFLLLISQSLLSLFLPFSSFFPFNQFSRKVVQNCIHPREGRTCLMTVPTISKVINRRFRNIFSETNHATINFCIMYIHYHTNELDIKNVKC